MTATYVQWILGAILLLASLGVVLIKKPVHACLSFLLGLLVLAALYLQLDASFVAVMQVLVYAGAILVIFMFVIVLFQDAHQQIERFKAQSWLPLLFVAASAFVVVLGLLGARLTGLKALKAETPEGFGTVQNLGNTLYLDFFFPFEAVIVLFLVALVGALYLGKKVR